MSELKLNPIVFDNEFNRLHVAHGRTIREDSKQYWYEMCEKLDDITFKRIFKKLHYCEKFPTFKMFRKVQFEIMGIPKGEEYIPPRSKCKYCRGDGKLFLEDSEGRSSIARCGACKLVTKLNKPFQPVHPDELPKGIKLSHAHILNLEWYEKETAAGRDPFDEEVVRGDYQSPEVGNRLNKTPDEKERAKFLKQEKERDLQNSWID